MILSRLVVMYVLKIKKCNVLYITLFHYYIHYVYNNCFNVLSFQGV